ncbi:ankyrin repeat domain-containing protein [Streptomyces sp. NPDC052225]|uniref:ankyrin repeat domain-containing protein n=1 Tax=Streptomyces sp. NPDC052225 TaxID=3154949 RepID=UPI0034159EDE
MEDERKAEVSGLFEAVHDGDEDAVVRLLRAGVPGEVCDADGESALYRAAMCDAPGIVRLLLAAGADPDRLSSGTDLPLCGAACGGHVEVVRALLAAGARADEVEQGGWRALTWAVQLGHEPVVRALLDGGADPRLVGPSGELPLVVAARRGSAGCVRALLEHGAAGREEALAQARRWLGVDVAERLRAELLASAAGDTSPEGAQALEAVVQRFREDGGVTVVVELLDGTGRPTRGNHQQTGHAAIATLLESSLGIATPAAELADRAVRCGDPDNDDWIESMEVLRRRGDEPTFRAAVAWCADRDPLRRAFAADVLGQLGTPGADGARPFARRAFPALRGAARTAGAGGGGPELRSVIGALGRADDPAAAPEVVRFARHPDSGVRRAVALALCGLTGGATTPAAPAVDALLGLCRDADPDVRTWAAAALAGSGADGRAVRDALAGLLDDPRDDVAAEAARGLAVRQDGRAVDTLARLLACAAPGDYARDVAQDGARALTDVRVRNRLEWTLPRRS